MAWRWFVVAVLFEIVLVGKIDVEETPVGAAIAAIAVAAAAACAAAAPAAFRPRLRWLPYVANVTRNIVRDTVAVYGVLWAALRGAPVCDGMREITFVFGGEDAESQARRALVVAGISTSPNAIVIDALPERERLRVHMLAPADQPGASPEWPL